MACRDVKTHKAKPIPQLVITTPQEAALQKVGKSQKGAFASLWVFLISPTTLVLDRKKALAETSLDTREPNQEESARLHHLFVGRAGLYEGKLAKPESLVWMNETELSGCSLRFTSSCRTDL